MPRLTAATVERDVVRVTRDVVIGNTIIDEDDFTLDLVPAKKYAKGWEAKIGNWARILGKIAERLRDPHEGGYEIEVAEADARDTLSKPLSDCVALLVTRIREG